MQSPAESLSSSAESHDHYVRFHDLSWADFETMLTLRGDHSHVRFTYLEGELELMSPSRIHELDKKKLARLIEAFAEERDIELEGYGSWTIKKEARRRGVEPDECYVVNPREHEPERPDFAIEVVHSSGGIDKLSVYQGLEVPEVWLFQRGKLQFHRLEAGGYVGATRSAVLPDLEPSLIEQCMEAPSQTDAVRRLRAALRSSE